MTDTELSLVLNFLQALLLAYMAQRQQATKRVVDDTNVTVKNGKEGG